MTFSTAVRPAGQLRYRALILADNPLVYWRLGESSGTTALDSSGNSRNATYTGSPTLGAAGALKRDGDTAVTFAGSGQYADIADAAWMDVTSGGITVEAWVKFTTNLSSAVHVVSRDSESGGASTSRVWALRIGSAEQVNLLLWNTSTSLSLSGATTGLNDGNWHHIAVTYDGTNGRVYVDGSLDATSSSFSGGLKDGAIAITVGRKSGGSGNSFPGTVDEVAFYATALSATRISAHYAAGA
jgi:hypothetical protein